MNGTWCRIGKNLFRFEERRGRFLRGLEITLRFSNFVGTRAPVPIIPGLGRSRTRFLHANRARKRTVPTRARCRFETGRVRMAATSRLHCSSLLSLLFEENYTRSLILSKLEFLNSWLKNRPSQVSKFIISSCIIGFQHSINLPAPTERRPT